MDLTPEMIEATGKSLVAVIGAVGAIVATIASAVVGFYTWKNRYELDRLYAATYRPNEDGTPGPMRHHPAPMVALFRNRVVAQRAEARAAEPDAGKAADGQ